METANILQNVNENWEKRICFVNHIADFFFVKLGRDYPAKRKYTE
jgi:hypothetical protein